MKKIFRYEKDKKENIICYEKILINGKPDWFAVVRLRKKRKEIYYIEVLTVEGEWKDIGYFGTEKYCKQFLENDIYDIF